MHYSALADALDEEAEEPEARRGDEVPLLHDHGVELAKALRTVRRRLRDFLQAEVEARRSVPMTCTTAGEHPTVRWTVRFGKWLATARLRASKASRWDLDGQGGTVRGRSRRCGQVYCW